MGNANLKPRFVGIKVQNFKIISIPYSILKIHDIHITTSINNNYNNLTHYYISYRDTE